MDLNLSSWTLPLCHVFVATTTERAKDFKTNSLSGQSNEESHSQSRRVCGWGRPAGFSSRNTSIQDAICGDALPKESDGISKTLSNGQRLLIFFWCCRVCCCRVYTSINQNNTRGIISILVIGPTTYLHQTILPASLYWCFVGMCMNQELVPSVRSSARLPEFWFCSAWLAWYLFQFEFPTHWDLPQSWNSFTNTI